MANKKDEGLGLLFQTILIVISSVFLINTAIVNHHFTKKYNAKEAPIRVMDAGNILRFLPALLIIGGLAFTAVLCVALFSEHITPIIQYIAWGIIVVLAIIAYLAISARIGTTQIGMLIFPDKDLIVIPTDPNKNSFVENILQAQLVGNMFSMEEIPLSKLKKITKQSGKKAFLHGTFGTRCVAWRNKQKRDECIAALEEARGKRLSL